MTISKGFSTEISLINKGLRTDFKLKLNTESKTDYAHYTP